MTTGFDALSLVGQELSDAEQDSAAGGLIWLIFVAGMLYATDAY